jgi:excisionase family DNA binding protein
MGSVQEVLVNYGVTASEEELAQVIGEALTAAGFAVPYADPRQTLDPNVVKLLEQGGFDLDHRTFDVRDPMLQAALEYALLRTTSLTTQQAAERLGVNNSRIRQRLAARALYGIKVGDEWRLPAFQFRDDGLVPGIDQVLPNLPENLNPVAVHRWFHLRQPDLSGAGEQAMLSPIEWLESGNDPTVVAELAAGL